MEELSNTAWSLAPRAAQTDPFLVMEVLERAQELERSGRRIIHLEVGEPDFQTPPQIAAAGIEAIRSGETHYTHSLGLPLLREAISARYARDYGVDVSPDRILVTAGSSLALLYVFGAILRPGDEVIVATPHYPCYPNFIRFFGGQMVEAPTDPCDGYRLNPNEVRKRITARTRAVLVNSPANPTGAVLDEARLQAIAGLGVPVVSDEIYHGLTYEGRAPSILEFLAPGHAYVVDGFSKRYAMTGWRLGWLVAPPGETRVFQKMQQNFVISANPFVQAAGIAAIANGEESVAAMRAVYDRRRHLLAGLFRRIGFRIPVLPQGAFYAFADASQLTDDSYAFAFELLESAGVGVAPGIDFGEAGRRAVRLSYAASEASIRDAAARIGGYLECRGRGPTGGRDSP